MKLSQIKENPNNPRTIDKRKFELLKKSIKDFPQMLALRPIVTDENGVSLGGNMRLKALRALGYKEIPDEWVKKASELTEEQKREFVIKDNSDFGTNDWDCLANEWSDLPLADWGVDVPNITPIGAADSDPGGSAYKEQYGVIVICADEAEQEKVYNRLLKEGLNCKVVVT